MMEEENQNSVGLMSVPVEVMYSCIFPHLPLNDLLRLRRVSKHLQLSSNDYIRNHYNHQEKEINTTDHTFADIARRDLPTSKIYLNNTNCSTFFEDPNCSDFLRLYAPNITNLRVKNFGTCISESENKFYLALTNLEHLELEIVECTDAGPLQLQEGDTSSPEEYYFPASFQNLQTLKFGKILVSQYLYPKYAWDFIKFCGNLQYIRHPLFQFWNVTSYDNYIPEGQFDWILKKRRKLLNHEITTTLKYYDLLYYQEHDRQKYGTTWGVFHLVQICHTLNIKLLNVDAKLNGLHMNGFTPSHLMPLVSTQNVNCRMLVNEMANLEKVVITSTRGCFMPTHLAFLVYVGGQARWPKLQTLDITIDSETTRAYRTSELDGAGVDCLLFYLFGDVGRAELRELRVKWAIELDARNYNFVSRVFFLGQRIVNTCGNLTKLTISNWNGICGPVAVLWSGLEKLEELTIDKCRKFKDVDTFIGEDLERPVFLKLTKLRKFTLSGLDLMPKITDQAFDVVFRHLKVKQFQLTSEEPIESVTIEGIRSLLTGDFNQHVEKFSFENWSLENVGQEEFSRLKLEFRASHML